MNGRSYFYKKHPADVITAGCFPFRILTLIDRSFSIHCQRVPLYGAALRFFRLLPAFLCYEPDHTVIPLLSVLFNQLRTRLNNLDSRHSIGINVIQVREIDQFPVNHHQWTRTVLRANGKPKSRIFDPPKSRPDLIRTSIYKCATDAFELSFLRLFVVISITPSVPFSP